MATETTERQEAGQNGAAPGLASLVGNILTDAQELTRQQIELFKVEIGQNTEKAKSIGVLVAAAVALVAVAGGMLATSLALFLFWAFPETLPLWGAYGIVALLLCVAAGVLFGVCKKQLDSFSLVPEKAVEAMKENLEWKTKPT